MTESATAVADADASEEIAASEPQVLDVFKYFDKTPQRTVQWLQHTQLLTGDDKVTDIQFLKLVNHALFGRFGENSFDDDTHKLIVSWQNKFREQLASKSVEELIESGEVNRMVEGYLRALANYHRGVITRLESVPVSGGDMEKTAYFNRKLEREQAVSDKLAKDLKHLHEFPDFLKNAIRKYPQVLKAGKYLPLGQIAVTAGMIDADPAKALDMVSDTLATATAHSLRLKINPYRIVPDEKTLVDLKLYAGDPQKYETQIQALAARIADAGLPLDNIQVNIDESPELARVQALKNLLSAQMHAAVTWSPKGPGSKPQVKSDPAHLIQVENDLKTVIEDYQSVAMSLAHEFLGKGPATNDPRMKQLRAQLEAMMAKESIALLPPERAEARASELARNSAQDLMQLSAENPGLEVKLRALLVQVDSKLKDLPLTPRAQLVGADTKTWLGAIMDLTKRFASAVGLGDDAVMPASHTERVENARERAKETSYSTPA